MKKFSFLALAAAGLLFAACSSTDDVAENELPVGNVGGEGFLGISIQLPDASSSFTRANDDLTNGKEDEFRVENAYLYLFQGASEASAKFVKRYELTNSFEADKSGQSTEPVPQSGVTLPNGTAITSTSVSVCRIDKLDLGSDKLYGYVVVNAQGGLSAEPQKGMNYSTFATQVLAAADNGGTLEGAISTKGLLMTNSPVCDKPGGEEAPADETLSTLVELDPTNIKQTEAEAKGAPAGCIYVERAAAKVTVQINSSATDINVQNDDKEKLAMSLTDVAWQVINTEPSFYNARQIEKTWDPYQSAYYTLHNESFRFVSLYKFDPKVGAGTHTKAYRTYFAKDIQYDTDANLDYVVAGGKIKGTETDRAWLGSTDRSFVPENTFDVAHQQRKNTTQVTLRVKFNGGNPFYTISDDAKFYIPTTINNKLAAVATDLYNVSAWMTKAAAVATTQFGVPVTVAIKAEVAESTTGKNNLGYTISYELTNTNTSASLVPNTTQKEAIEAAATDDGYTWADVKAEAESEVKVTYYAGGLAYYNIRIQHFGIKETPWSANGEYITKPGTGTNGEYVINDIYGTTEPARSQNFLGRYGVVRDNWYNLRIDEINKLGSAEPLTVQDDPTPDDEVTDEYYIAAHVHILPWVLRVQTVNL